MSVALKTLLEAVGFYGIFGGYLGLCWVLWGPRRKRK